MQVTELQTIAIDALNDLKAVDLVVFDVRTLTTITDTMIICSGTSNRHVTSMAGNIVKKAKENQVSYIRTEGEREGEWVIIDLADVIIHIMQPAARKFYNLEDLWEPIMQVRGKKG